MHKMVAPIVVLAVVFALTGSVAVRAEIISVPPEAASDPPASPPPPTVLRGSPASAARPIPICPPGYTLSSDYGCVAPSGGDYTEGSPGYDYWPDYGYDYPFGGFPGFGFGADRFHRFAGVHSFHRFAGVQNGRALHGRAGFHSAAGFHSFGMGIGHVGGFGRR